MIAGWAEARRIIMSQIGLRDEVLQEIVEVTVDEVLAWSSYDAGQVDVHELIEGLYELSDRLQRAAEALQLKYY
jgi:hypothetical protein